MSAIKLCEELHASLTNVNLVHEDSIVSQMLDIVDVVLELKEDAKTIEKYQLEIGAVAKILEVPDNLNAMTPDERTELAKNRQEQLQSKRDEFYVRSDLNEKKSKKACNVLEKSENSKIEITEQVDKILDEMKLMGQFFKTTNSFGPNLLTFLEVPNLPATNNGTEQTFGRVRTNLRRITGRQNNHSTIYSHGAYLVLAMNDQTLEQITDRISGVSYSDYCTERKNHVKQRSHLIVKAKLRKDSKKFFGDLELQWILANS